MILKIGNITTVDTVIPENLPLGTYTGDVDEIDLVCIDQ